MYKYVQQVSPIRIQMDKRYYLYIVGGFDTPLSVRHCAPWWPRQHEECTGAARHGIRPTGLILGFYFYRWLYLIPIYYFFYEILMLCTLKTYICNDIFIQILKWMLFFHTHFEVNIRGVFHTHFEVNVHITK